MKIKIKNVDKTEKAMATASKGKVAWKAHPDVLEVISQM